MPIRIFYAWQSDSPANSNRYFIRDALEATVLKLNENLQLSGEDAIFLDYDTNEVPGSPDIVATILKKIENSELLVADMTLVSSVGDGKHYPNGNVAIEYGYALRHLGDSRMIAVMNEHYGSIDDLPFDIRHRRAPIRYLRGSEKGEVRQKQLDELANNLYQAIRLAIERVVIPNRGIPKNVEQTPMRETAGLFYQYGDTLAYRMGRTGASVAIRSLDPVVPFLYLRVSGQPTGTTLSTLDADRALRSSNLQTLDRTGGGIHGTNKYGAICYEIEDSDANPKLLSFTQVTRSREIWGVNYSMLDAERLMDFSKVDFVYLPMGALEVILERGLASYLAAAKGALAMTNPINIVCGLHEVENYQLTLPSGYMDRFAGRIAIPEVAWSGTLDSTATDARKILTPFYDLIWAEAGVQRPVART